MNNVILQKNISETFEKIKTILKILDFSDEQIIKQMKELGEVMIMSIWLRFSETKNNQSLQTLKQEFTQENLEKFLNENYSKEEIQDIIKQESEKIITDYFTEISKNASEEKLSAIEKVLEDIKELERIRKEIEMLKNKEI